jgi:hypothetical protein
MQAGAQITRICTITGNMGALKSATPIGGSRATVMSRSAISAAPAPARPGAGWSRAAQGRPAIGAAGRWGYWRVRRGRNLIQARMAVAAMTAGMVTVLRPGPAVCGWGV